MRSLRSSCVWNFSSRLILLSTLFGIVSITTLCPAQDTAPASAAVRPLITQPIDESQLTTLKGNTHPLARPVFDIGTAPATLPMERMLLVLKRSPQQEATLRSLLDNQQDKGSTNYHKWLTPDRFGKQFGPTDDDLQKITAWLQSHGFQVGTTKGRTVLEFSGSASQVQQAFHTTIHKYVVNGEQHWANASDPKIPTALTPVVAGVFTLHNFVKKAMHRVAKERFEATLRPGKPPLFTASNGLHALAPADFATIYNVAPLYTATPPITGSGISIGVVGRSDIIAQDITDFRNVFAITGPAPQIIVNGPDPGDVPGDDLEATLDVSWSGGVAPGAQVYFVNSGTTNTTDGVTLSELYIIDNDLSNIMTYSFGGCEPAFGTTEATLDSSLGEQAAAQGISFMASTGDAGAEGCDDPNTETVATGPIAVNLPASTPFATAVGGTIFNEGSTPTAYWSTSNNATDFGSALSYIPEDVWNESCTTACAASVGPNILAGGGGVSTLFTSKPSWQSGVTGIPNDNARDLPDIVLSAAVFNDPYLLCFQASCVPDAQNLISFFAVGGTSASTPSFAGVMALVDQNMSLQPPVNLNNNSSRQGLANYVLYPLAAAQQAAHTVCNASTATLPASTCVFNDVTSGNNAVPGETGFGTSTALYQATAGYDLATGLGSLNVANLVDQWALATFRATTTTLMLNSTAGGNTVPVTAAHGAAVNVSITVAANSGTVTPAGDVSLTAATGGSLSTRTGVEGFSLTGGAFTGTTTTLPGGQYSVTAHYGGNTTAPPTAQFAPSDSSPGVLVNITPENSTTTLSLVANDLNGNLLTSPFPFGSLVFVRADVVGLSGQGVATGTVTFTDTLGPLPALNPQSNPPVAVINPVPLNSQGNAAIGDGIISFDAGNHSISATYNSDSSFNTSSSTQPVTFTVQPGFAVVSGFGSVSIASAGSSGTTTVGIVTSSNFPTAVTFTCTGLPSEATCSPASATGKGPITVVNTTITVNTTGPHQTKLQSNQRSYYFAALGGGLPLAGIFFVIAPKRRRFGAILGLMVLALLMMVPACGGGGGGSRHQLDPGTPAGTYTVTITVSANGAPSEAGQFSLVVQ